MQSVANMKKAEIENSIVNGYHTILLAIRQIEAGMTEVADSSNMLKKLFDREAGGPNSKWSFFDDIVRKYLASPSHSEQHVSGDEEVENEAGAVLDWRERLACALVAVCLCDYDEMVRFVFDIFARSSPTRKEMSIQDYINILRTILPSQNAEDGSFDNYINAFELYVSSHPILPATRRRANGEEDDGRGSEGDTSFPTSIAVQYHVKVHKELLWPLKVAHEQVKKKFLGVNYWTGMRAEMAACPESCSLYLPSAAVSFSSYVQTLLALSSSHHSVSKLPIPPSSSSPSCSTTTSNCSSTRSSPQAVPREIVEMDGIYTYRHLESVGVGRSKYTSCSSPPTVVHLHSAVDQLMKGTSASTASRRFPSPEHAHSATILNADVDGARRKKMRSKSAPDMRRAAATIIRNSSGFNILIIEDSKLQRKMMRHQLCKSGMTTFEKKDTEKDTGSETSTEPNDDEASPPSTMVSSVPVPMPLESVVDLSDAEREKVWTVSEASNGEEAIQMIIDTQSSFDVLFVDENLQHSGGNMLGHEFVSILRGHSSVPPTTVIIGCSSNAHMYVSNFLNAGADAVWQKPMPSSDLIHSEICRYIDRRLKCSM